MDAKGQSPGIQHVAVGRPAADSQQRAVCGRHAAGMPGKGAERRGRDGAAGDAADHRQRADRPARRCRRVPLRGPRRRADRRRGARPTARFAARFDASADRRPPASNSPSTTTSRTRARGCNTHHADSWLTATLPADGTYYLHLADAQQKGGPEYAYRLRISRPRPDFAIRVAPASINARAGMSLPINIYAMRQRRVRRGNRGVAEESAAGFRPGAARRSPPGRTRCA